MRAARSATPSSALRSTTPDGESIKAAAAHATDGAEIMDDKHAPADYRARVTRNLTRRAIERALG